MPSLIPRIRSHDHQPRIHYSAENKHPWPEKGKTVESRTFMKSGLSALNQQLLPTTIIRHVILFAPSVNVYVNLSLGLSHLRKYAGSMPTEQ